MYSRLCISQELFVSLRLFVEYLFSWWPISLQDTWYWVFAPSSASTTLIMSASTDRSGLWINFSRDWMWVQVFLQVCILLLYLQLATFCIFKLCFPLTLCSMMSTQIWLWVLACPLLCLQSHIFSPTVRKGGACAPHWTLLAVTV